MGIFRMLEWYSCTRGARVRIRRSWHRRVCVGFPDNLRQVREAGVAQATSIASFAFIEPKPNDFSAERVLSGM